MVTCPDCRFLAVPESAQKAKTAYDILSDVYNSDIKNFRLKHPLGIILRRRTSSNVLRQMSYEEFRKELAKPNTNLRKMEGVGPKAIEVMRQQFLFGEAGGGGRVGEN